MTMCTEEQKIITSNDKYNAESITQGNLQRYDTTLIIGIVQIVIAILTLFIAIVSFCVSCSSKKVADRMYDIAQSTYRHDSSDYRASLSITKDGESVYIKNTDAELFEVNSIQFVKADEYNIFKDNANTSIEVTTMNCFLSSGGDTLIDLNDVCIDTSKRNVINNQEYFSENDNMLFDNIYKDKILELQRLYNVHAGRVVYHIVINYFNKYTYETQNLPMTIYPENNGEIKRIYPYMSSRGISIDLVNNYQNINEKWEDIINQINIILENNQY